MGKIIKRIILVVVILLVVLLVAAFLMIDWIAKVGVERGGTYALGVDTTVDALSLSLFRGQLTMDGLTIGNPEGYKMPHLMKSGRFEIEIVPSSVFTETIEMKRFELDRLDVNIEQKIGTTNVSEILANLEKIKSDEEKAEEEKEGKRLKVDRIVITTVLAKVQLLPVGGEATVLTIALDRLELTDVGSDSDKGLLVSDLIRQLVPAVLSAVVEKGEGVIPADLMSGLRNDIAKSAEALGEQGAKLVKQAGESAGKMTEEVGKKAKEVEKGVGGALDKLLGKEKKEEGKEE